MKDQEAQRTVARFAEPTCGGPPGATAAAPSVVRRGHAGRSLVPAPLRLRVCHIMSADLWAGAEVQLATVAAYLVERPNVELTAILFNEGPLADELRRLGVPVTVFDEGRHSAAGIFVSLVRWLRAHPVDLVHTHRAKDTVVGVAAAKVAGVAAVVRTLHGESEPYRGWARLRYRLYEALDTATLRCFADRVVAVSGRMAEGLVRSGHRAERVARIHNGVDLGRVRASRPRAEVRRELGVAPGTPLIGTVGRLTPVKAHALLLSAARLILQREPAARFLVVGDGELRSELEGTARTLGIDAACVFAGARTDVFDLVSAMDVFVLSSLREGIPMALLEAMALGTPVVATAVGGLPEVVTHGVTGLLVGSQDAPGLAAACLELTGDPVRAAELAARARRVIEERFSHEHNGAALMDAYLAVTRAPRAVVRRRLRSTLAPVARGARALAAAATLPRRRRLERIRRRPDALVARLRVAQRVLIVCHGNIIRSAFAARLATQALVGVAEVVVSSAGLAAVPGTASPSAAAVTAARHDVDLGGHVASPVTAEAVAASDVVFVMDMPQLQALERRFPRARGKVFLLTSLAAEWPLEVRDPFGEDDSVFQACFEQISASVRPIVRVLAERCERR